VCKQAQDTHTFATLRWRIQMLDRSGLSDVHELKLNGVQTKLVIFHKENYDLSRKCRSKNIIERLNLIIIWFKTYI
jgi:hypothetical protein